MLRGKGCLEEEARELMGDTRSGFLSGAREEEEEEDGNGAEVKTAVAIGMEQQVIWS